MEITEYDTKVKFEMADGYPKVIENITSSFGIWHVAAYHNGKFYLLLSKEPERREVLLYISSDGEHFTPHENNPVLKRGNKGEFDDARIEPHGLVFHDNKWMLYYGGYSWNYNRPILNHFSKRGKWRLGLAESYDLVSWKKHHLNPIFSKKTHVADPRVVKYKDKFFLYYFTSKPGCYLAYSYDGLHWQDYNGPIFDGLFATFIVKDDTLISFYRWKFEAIGVAFSTDGFRWKIPSKGMVIQAGMMPPWDSSGVVWPFTVETPEALFLYYSIIDASKIWRLAVAKLYAKY
jgi:predicted GH43/DUF377 family glycosyl hydrolase